MESQTAEYDFSWGSFWLQLLNVPFKYMNEQVGRIIGLKPGFLCRKSCLLKMVSLWVDL